MTTFYDTFVEKSESFLKRLEKSEGQPIDIQEVFFSFTMDSIEKFFFGTEVNTVEGGMSQYAKAFDGAHLAMQQTLRENIPAMIMAKVLLPFPFGALTSNQKYSFNLTRSFVHQRSAYFKKFEANLKVLEDHIDNYVRTTRQDPHIQGRKDIIANFLNSKIGDQLSNKTLKDIVLNLTIAGRDTTACALTWLMFELTQNLDVQDQLCKEIDQVLEGRVPTMDELEATQMPFLNGVIYETLRLHPPVPNDTKMAEKDLIFEDGTFIPKQTKLIYSPYCMGRNPVRFPEPLKFDPNRWIPFKQPDLYEFPVFQAGPRFCLGKDMAQFEMKLLMVLLLQKFKFKLKPGEEKKVSYSLMITMSVATNKEKSQCELLVIPTKRIIE